MKEQNKRSGLRPWKPGESGNPLGRPLGTRNKFSEDVVAVLANDWAIGGPDVVARVRQTDPSTYLRVMASILPKDVLVSVQQQSVGNLDPDEWRLLVDLVKLIKLSAPEGSQALPSEIVPAIEETVRAHFAKEFAMEIEPVGSKAVAIEYLDGGKVESVQSDSETE